MSFISSSTTGITNPGGFNINQSGGLAGPPVANAPLASAGLLSGANAPQSGGNTTTFGPTSDELGELNQISLKASSNSAGIAFPAVLFKEDNSNSLSIHEYPNLPGARVENMGLHASRFHIKAILTNNVYPGISETWVPGLLFPNVFINLVNLLTTPGNKVLIHPIYGDITVQVINWTYELNPHGPRDGAYVDMDLIQTINDNVPASSTLTAPFSVGLANAAGALDAVITNSDPALNPPGLSLGQLFTGISQGINQALAYPNSIIAAANEDIIAPVVNGISQIGNSIVNAPSYISQQTTQNVQLFKNSVANTTISQAYQQITSGFSVGPTSIPGPSIAAPALSYSQSSITATNSVLSLNNTPSQNAPQYISKVQNACTALLQHYVDLNTSAANPIIAAVRQMLYQVELAANQLNVNTSLQNVIVATFVTRSPMTWQSLAIYLNNSIDDLLNLNNSMVNDFWIASNQTISFFQAQ